MPSKCIFFLTKINAGNLLQPYATRLSHTAATRQQIAKPGSARRANRARTCQRPHASYPKSAPGQACHIAPPCKALPWQEGITSTPSAGGDINLARHQAARSA